MITVMAMRTLRYERMTMKTKNKYECDSYAQNHTVVRVIRLVQYKLLHL